MKNILKNLKYTVAANSITLVISVIITLVLPRKLGVSNYGFYQLYLFYTSYASIFHFGLPDGIYLKLGGEYYEQLDKNMLKGQFTILSIMSILLGCISIFFFGFSNDSTKKMVLSLSILSIVMTNLKVYLLFILQTTNRIKEYAKYTRLDRILFFCSSIFYVLFIGNNYTVVIGLDIMAKSVVLFLLMIVMKDIFVHTGLIKWKNALFEAINNILIGSKLMLSYVAGILIIGIIRFSIELKWSIEDFSKVSLVLSLSNMMMTFINAVSVVLFPILRRMDEKSQKDIFSSFRNILVPLSFVSLILYYPLQIFISYWLPSYQDSIFYMGVLFPIFIYEGKVSLLSNTFLKTFRKEKTILLINIISLSMSIIMAIVSIAINSLTFAVFSILFVIIIRSNLSELYVTKLLDVKYNYLILFELMMTFGFVLLNISFNKVVAFFCYSLLVVAYLCITKDKIRNSISIIKKIR
ncbi:hypothetical protein IGI37_000782 [Enterococcus sp. AZ194]|uniref:lipopolysaccharide biosynthesis protein n=1 Tax=Enterococcus sp. AZ194 TaxID=2774629 RepID=UPI003F224ED7